MELRTSGACLGFSRDSSRLRELLRLRNRCGFGCRRGVGSPSGPDPFLLLWRTLARRFLPSGFHLPDIVRTRALRRETDLVECAARRRGHRGRWRVRRVAERSARLDSQCDCRDTPSRRCGSAGSLLLTLTERRRRWLRDRARRGRRTWDIPRSGSADLSPAARAGRCSCRGIRRCWPCHLSWLTWCSRRRA